MLKGVYSGLNSFLCVSKIWRIQFKGLLKIRIGKAGRFYDVDCIPKWKVY